MKCTEASDAPSITGKGNLLLVGKYFKDGFSKEISEILIISTILIVGLALVAFGFYILT